MDVRSGFEAMGESPTKVAVTVTELAVIQSEELVADLLLEWFAAHPST
jgi:hypothetical protein